ncbi:hypothetical protein CAPTEDRAFT_173229 [Capitella teleta]|uniref:sn-1-specific diacylglycerol lipase ABHD11 n=1 Tax=Capitella teleta TaxID=283909 RepID=R7TAD7_CAPTE|nr:hypothetical protein CAPTEDRAFT_173229 [Capitella teleta]|eukprot:ELT90452.1 hypothetical protein CAPTEDRAFT_173229 [Capitella teleta]
MNFHFRTVKLAYSTFQDINAEPKGPALILMHGMFGNKKNFNSIAKVLSKTCQKVITLDARNHGDSPHVHEMDYFLMSEDVEELMQDLGLKRAAILGHSMGGKVAMVLALTKPHLVSKLIISDIAPDVTRTAGLKGFPAFINAMQSVKLGSNIQKISEARREASRQLAERIPEKGLRDFVITNIEQRNDQFYWRVNLDCILESIEHLMGFPSIESCFQGDTLFIRGSLSDCILESHEADISFLFPESRLMTIHGAGHWVHADKPHEFLKAVKGFIVDETGFGLGHLEV